MASDQQMVPLKALHEAREQSRKLRTENAVLKAEKAGWLTERERLMALLEHPSLSCSACAMLRSQSRT